MLVEREGVLAVLAAALDEALRGDGRLVFVGGEAGVGKTSVVAAAAARAPEHVQVRRGVVDNVTTAVALGSLVDAVPELSDAVGAAGEVARPTLFRTLRTALSSAPTLLILEDVHWADEATLDMLRYVGRRLDGLPLLVLATYRTEEVTARHPLAVVMGDLATSAGVERLVLEPMSAAAVAELVVASGSIIEPAGLYERTGGNAFFVTEVLATPDTDLPATIRDAVLARVSRISAPARDVLAAAAVLGSPADALLLAEVPGRPADAVDESVDHGLLVADRDGWAYRHELARVAVEQTIAPGRVAALNRRAYAALVVRHADDDRRLAHHAARGGDRAKAHRHAVRAAARAARLGAHREAAQQYRLALRVHDGDGPAREDLLAALSYECYLTDELAEALANRLKAMEVAELEGRVEARGRHERWVSRLSWFLGRNADSERYAARAVASLEAGSDDHELGMAYSNRAQLCMLAGDLDGTSEWGTKALAVARRTGDREVEMHALNNIGTARWQHSDEPQGRVLLQRSLELALAEDAQEHVARAYTNLGSMADTRRDDAVPTLRAGIAYCTDRDLDSWRLYMGAHLSHALAEHGHYDEARRCAADVLRHPNLSPISAIVASAAAAQIAARRGEDAAELLDRAWQLAAGTGEAQRLVPAAAARAEADWLAGRPHPAPALEVAERAARARTQPWIYGELAYWRGVWDLPVDPGSEIARPFALMLAGEWTAAAAEWDARNCPLWRAYALAASPDLAAATAALAIVDSLDAPAVRQAILRTRHAAGLPVPRGPRAATTDNPGALTARELEVLTLLADGLSNAEISARLFLSEKTVGHHVSAVLRKTNQPTRTRAAAWAVRAGVVTAADGTQQHR